MSGAIEILLLVYSVLSLPLAGWAVWVMLGLKDENAAMRADIVRLDEDIDDLWDSEGPEGPGDGEDNVPVPLSNVVAFAGRRRP